jgi:lactoylglutathione lyase
MRIEHIAIWVSDLEKMKSFYQKYFDAKPNNKYVNSKKGFESYFLQFSSGARLELMKMDSIPLNSQDPIKQYTGLIHFAISVGSKKAVEKMTARLHSDGFQILNGPRTTGDDYYESVVLDPEGNRIELTI